EGRGGQGNAGQQSCCKEKGLGGHVTLQMFDCGDFRSRRNKSLLAGSTLLCPIQGADGISSSGCARWWKAILLSSPHSGGFRMRMAAGHGGRRKVAAGAVDAFILRGAFPVAEFSAAPGAIVGGTSC